MHEYRRSFVQSGTYFFTVVTDNRLPSLKTVEEKFGAVKDRLHPTTRLFDLSIVMINKHFYLTTHPRLSVNTCGSIRVILYLR